MPFHDTEPYLEGNKTASLTGVRASLMVKKNGSGILKIWFSEPQQERLFGLPMADLRFRVRHGSGDEWGLVEIRIATDGGTKAKKGLKGDALWIKPWDGLKIEKHQPGDCEILRAGLTGGPMGTKSVILRLPASLSGGAPDGGV